ncbi:c-type cytochrome domain-containing protein [Shewanella sp. cp20]|uniref:c-type cytochrome domain-containing protein n=1 Tax=Shewanella sp. cp20 TaxID=1521167 RepID=UPI0005A11267|nr:c-type cytochrome domain-containing protein [Shewanella sp. cp20]KIO35874.1 hypothetical protein DB48_14375 [Shewanella sp. cp20]
MYAHHSIDRRLLLVAALATTALLGCERPVSFSSQVQPILNASCISCHAGAGEGMAKTHLALDSYEGVMRGTQLGPVVVPGSAASSTLYLAIDHKVDSKIQMPPHHSDKFAQGEGKPLSSEQIATIKRWIDEGAKQN